MTWEYISALLILVIIAIIIFYQRKIRRIKEEHQSDLLSRASPEAIIIN